MANYQIIDFDDKDYFDVLVEVGFENRLSVSDIEQVSKLIENILTDKIMSQLFETLSSLELNEKKLTIQFRFARKTDAPYKLGTIEGEDLSRLKMQSIFYLFAKINQQYKLNDVPFPPNYQSFISLPDDVKAMLQSDN